MGEVLSQSEIDALLSALSSGEIEFEDSPPEEKHRVKKYDFKRPNKFSKEHIKTLEMVYDNFSRTVSNFLTAQLRTSVNIKVVSTEQITFEEFIRSIPNPTILMTFYLDPFTGPMMFETEPQFVFQLIDILFGGTGKSIIKTREFTEIEKNIMKKINLKMLENLKLAWEDIMDVNVRFESLETNPVLNQVIAPNEPVVLVTMSVEIDQNQSFMNMCIPYMSLEKHMEKLIIQYKTAVSSVDDLENKKRMEKNLSDVKVDIFVELGRSYLTVEDFLNISVGDCITLNEKINDTLKLYIEDKAHFKVYPGTIGKKLGVQIVEIIDEDVKEYE
ncbi:flagellar motor switch protein FliM [Fonticella tunisiensis]|uniref:Flagellar motor switch protein FliM n=1 Tax=Fonticella tunisiensis TaxID=1096341 RepID=A0A4R7KAG6_9CLOT|nr:flagellar motor switch protein FliM [Fonticella tunisiensis]TDT50627.1 flagellar motor switch protein FliM [Fonticella tunisiensis]